MDHRRKTSGTTPGLTGQYANYFEIGHNAYEFLIDFGQSSPERKTAQLHTRIITGPVYAKELLETLQESIHQYEVEHGAIPKQ